MRSPDDGGSYAFHPKDLDVSDATPPAGFGRPDLTAFARLDGLGLSVTGQRLEPDRAVLACRVVEPDQWCRRCGSEGAARDTVIRRLAHEPLGWRPTVLEVVVRRYRCADCGHVWRQDTSAAAEPRAKLSRTGLRWALEGIVVAHLTVARVAEGLGVAWDTANNAVLAEGKRLLINDPMRFEGVKVIGVDEHVWRHTRRGDKYVTVIIDLTPVRDGAGPARLLDMVEGRSKAAFKTWLADRDDAFRDVVGALFVDDAHVEVEATWGVYQRMIAAYRHEDRQRGRELMEKLITDLSAGVPKVLTELTTLGRTLKKRAADVLAYFERPGTSNGPTEALNGRLEHLRGSALGFRNLTNYIARSLLETGGFRPQLLHPRLG